MALSYGSVVHPRGTRSYGNIFNYATFVKAKLLISVDVSSLTGYL
jgi:hypothetical protein